MRKPTEKRMIFIEKSLKSFQRYKINGMKHPFITENQAEEMLVELKNLQATYDAWEAEEFEDYWE